MLKPSPVKQESSASMRFLCLAPATWSLAAHCAAIAWLVRPGVVLAERRVLIHWENTKWCGVLDCCSSSVAQRLGWAGRHDGLFDS